MQVDKSTLTSLIQAALSADYTSVRRLGQSVAKQLADQNDVEGAREIQNLLRKRGVPLQASGFVESLPRDSATKLPLIEEGHWPNKPIMLNGDTGRTVSQFIEDAKHIDLLTQKGVSARLGLLIYGPPGTGKSMLASHIAAQLNRPVYVARLDSIISSRLGETAKNIRSIFEFVPTTHSVLFLDEMDAIAKLRDDRHELGELKRVVNTVLQGLDSLNHDVVTIGATNHQHLLDPAIWRRFPYKLELGAPDSDVRASMWSHFLFEDAADKKDESELLARASADLSGADIENIALATRRRAILTGQNFDLVQVLLGIRGHRGDARSPDGHALTREDKQQLTAFLHDKAKLSPVEIAKILGVSRQMVYRYIREQGNG